MEADNKKPDSARVNEGYEGPGLIIEGTTAPTPIPTDYTNKPDSEQKTFGQRFFKPIPVLTAVIAFATIIQCAVTYWQLQTMGSQLEEMKTNSKDATQLRKATEEIAKGMHRAIERSDAALKATIEASRREQRPYMIALTPQFVGTPTEGKVVQVNISFRNIGRTPAINGKIYGDIKWFIPLNKTDPKAPDQIFSFITSTFKELITKADNPRGKYAAFAREDTAPGVPTRFSTLSNNTPLTREDIANLRTGALTLFVVGIIRYAD